MIFAAVCEELRWGYGCLRLNSLRLPRRLKVCLSIGHNPVGIEAGNTGGIRLKKFETLVDEFVRCTRERRNVDYASRISVAKYNALARKRTKIARAINEYYHDRIDDFLALLDCDEWDVRVACAVHVIHDISCTEKQRQSAIHLIRKYIEEAADPVEALGFTMNLQDWGASSGSLPDCKADAP